MMFEKKTPSSIFTPTTKSALRNFRVKKPHHHSQGHFLQILSVRSPQEGIIRRSTVFCFSLFRNTVARRCLCRAKASQFHGDRHHCSGQVNTAASRTQIFTYIQISAQGTALRILLADFRNILVTCRGSHLNCIRLVHKRRRGLARRSDDCIPDTRALWWRSRCTTWTC